MKPDADLFRRESARLVASLTRAFGAGNLALVEDVVQETLARAFAAWSHEGVPEHYAPLLMTAAKNRALDAFRRERSVRRLAPEVQHFVESERAGAEKVEELFLPDALREDELRMMFSCCHPRLNEDIQAALILNIAEDVPAWRDPVSGEDGRLTPTGRKIQDGHPWAQPCEVDHPLTDRRGQPCFDAIVFAPDFFNGEDASMDHRMVRTTLTRDPYSLGVARERSRRSAADAGEAP